MVQAAIDFFDFPLFSIIGGLTVLISTAALLIRAAMWTLGITPIILKFGMALKKSKVAIFATADAFASLQTTVVESGVLPKGRLSQITPDNMAHASSHQIFLVDWESFGEHIDEIFQVRANTKKAIVIFAKPQTIPHEKMEDIANRPHTVVVNFRGRLLNDILTSLVTTSYDS